MDNVSMEMLQVLSTANGVISDLQRKAQEATNASFDALFSQAGNQKIAVDTANVPSQTKEDQLQTYYRKETAKSVDKPVSEMREENAGTDFQSRFSSEEEKATLGTKLEAATAQIKEKLCDLFGFSQDELEDMLESLGFTGVDLLQLDHLVTLVSEMTPQEEGDSFLVLISPEFNEVRNLLKAVTQELSVELELPMDQKLCEHQEFFQEILSQMQEVSFEEISMDPTPEENLVSLPAEASQEEVMLPAKDQSSEVLPTDEVSADFSALTEVNPEEAVAMTGEKEVSEQPAEFLMKTEINTGNEVKNEVENTDTIVTDDVVNGSEVSAQTKESDAKQEDDGQKETGADYRKETDADYRKETEVAQTVSEGKEAEEVFLPKNNRPRQAMNFVSTEAGNVSVHYQNEIPSSQVAMETVSSYVDVEKTMDLISQISRQVSVNVTEDISTMEIQLSPASLGNIHLNVSVKAGMVTAQLAAENEAVKHALETQVEVLKENLNAHGLKVESVEVTVASHSFERNLEENSHSQEQRQEEQKQNLKQEGRRNLRMDGLDELQGLMTDEEALIARMMAENGNRMDLSA